MPALFHASELSCAQSSSVSNITTSSVGSSSFSTVPSVALMMPAPISATSGSSFRFGGAHAVCSLIAGRWLELQVGAVFIDDVGPAPRVLADQLPLVARPGVVLREQDVTRADEECRARFRLELERARQGDHEPRDRVLVPLVGSARACLLKDSSTAGTGWPTESPRIPPASSIEPSSNSESPSSPVHIRTQRIITGPLPTARWRVARHQLPPSVMSRQIRVNSADPFPSEPSRPLSASPASCKSLRCLAGQRSHERHS